MTDLAGENRKTHYQKRMVVYIVAMAFGSTAYGYAAAVIATTLGMEVFGADVLALVSCSDFSTGQPSFYAYMGLDTDTHLESILGACVSLFYAGGFFGALFNSWCADALGRKLSIAIACGIMVVSTALCAGSVHIAMFIVFRFFTGWR